MRVTLGYAEEQLAEYIEGGSCDTETRRKRIGEAIRVLLSSGDYDLPDRYCFRTHGGCITLPPDVDYIKKVNVEGRAGTMHSQWYEFMEGAGDTSCKWNCREWNHRGSDWVTFAELPCPMRLVALTDNHEDVDLDPLFVAGPDANGEPVRTSPSPSGDVRYGEHVPISVSAQPVYSKNSFSRLTLVEKVPTKGIIRLYGYIPPEDGCCFSGDPNEMFMIGYYLPWETRPAYSRYEIPEACGECGWRVTAMVKRKWVPLVHRDQILPISNLDAIIDQLMANMSRRNADPAARRIHENEARKRLAEESDRSRSHEHEIDVRLFTPDTLEGGYN